MLAGEAAMFSSVCATGVPPASSGRQAAGEGDRKRKGTGRPTVRV